MECDSRLIQVKGALEGFDGGSISSYVSEANTAFSSLGSCFGSMGDTLSGAGIWQDVVATSFGSNIESIKSSMESLKSIPPSVEGVSGMVSGLVSTIESYENAVESYNSMESQYNNLNVGSRPSKKEDESVSSYNSRLSAYNRAVNEKNQLKVRMDNAKEEAETLKGDSYSQLNAIDGMMGGSGSFAPAAGGGGGVGGRSEVKIETDADGNKTTRTIYYDGDKKISEDYVITDKNGEQIEDGHKTYYDDGKVKTWKYNAKYDKEEGGSVKNKEIVYRTDGTKESVTIEEVLDREGYEDVGSFESRLKNVKRIYDQNENRTFEKIETRELCGGSITYTNEKYEVVDGIEYHTYDSYVDDYKDVDGNQLNYESRYGVIEYEDKDGNFHQIIKEGVDSDGNHYYGFEKGGENSYYHWDSIEEPDGTVYKNVNTDFIEDPDSPEVTVCETIEEISNEKTGMKEYNVTETSSYVAGEETAMTTGRTVEKREYIGDDGTRVTESNIEESYENGNKTGEHIGEREFADGRKEYDIVSTTEANGDIVEDVSLDSSEEPLDDYSSTGGTDGHHYTSKEDAIDYLVKNANMTPEQAKATVDSDIKNGTIVVDSNSNTKNSNGPINPNAFDNYTNNSNDSTRIVDPKSNNKMGNNLEDLKSAADKITNKTTDSSSGTQTPSTGNNSTTSPSSGIKSPSAGGNDGHHYPSEESAIDYLTQNANMTPEQAKATVDSAIKNGTITIDSNSGTQTPST